MSTTKQLHWSEKRSTPVDRTKRVAYGCKIEPTNIISARTRRRTDFDYSQTNLGRNGKLALSKRKKVRPSANIKEKREKKVDKKKDEDKTPKKRKSEDTEEERPTKKRKTDDVEEESKSKTVKSRKSTSRRKSEGSSPLAPAVVKALEKLEIKVPKVSKTPRKYRVDYTLPDAFDVFGNIKWPQNTYFMNKELDLYGLEFIETDIAEAKDYDFLAKNSDYYIVAEGEHMIVARLSGKDHADFEVHVVKEDQAVEGPYKISEVLTGLEIDNETTEEGTE
jgi:hypothetical protein